MILEILGIIFGVFLGFNVKKVRYNNEKNF